MIHWRLKSTSAFSQALRSFLPITLLLAVLIFLGAAGSSTFREGFSFLQSLKILGFGVGVPSFLILLVVAPVQGLYYAKRSRKLGDVQLPAFTTRAGIRHLVPRVGFYLCVVFSIYLASYFYFVKNRDRAT